MGWVFVRFCGVLYDKVGGWEGGGRTHLVACLTNLTMDHAPLTRRSIVPAPDGDTSNIWALSTLFT